MNDISTPISDYPHRIRRSGQGFKMGGESLEDLRRAFTHPREHDAPPSLAYDLDAKKHEVGANSIVTMLLSVAI